VASQCAYSFALVGGWKGRRKLVFGFLFLLLLLDLDVLAEPGEAFEDA
jgi:hypothetical protein